MVLVCTVGMVHGPTEAAADDPPRRAGEVTALLPKALAERATGSKDLAIKDEVFLNDLVKTVEAGRVRIVLDDKSILNIGARSSLRIVQHDMKTRQSRLELEFGALRARIIKGLQPQPNFEVTTRTAALGSVGTQFYVRGDDKEATIIGLEDGVRVRNRDPNVTGEETVSYGELTKVAAGMPPSPKRLATPQEMRQAMEETMPAPTGRLEPFQTPAGSNPRILFSAPGIDHLPKIQSEAPIEMEPGPCATSGYVTGRMKLSPDNEPGAYEIVFDAPGKPIMSALLVQPRDFVPPPTPGKMIHAQQLAEGSLHRGVVVGEAAKPLAGQRVRIRQDGKERVVETDAAGAFEFRAEKPGAAELFLDGTDRRSSVEILKSFDPLSHASRFARAGDALNLPGVFSSARVGNHPAALASTQVKKGEGFSTIELPLDAEDGPGEVTLVDASGKEHQHRVFVFRILGGRIDNPSLISGQKTQGEFVVCFGNALAAGQSLNAVVTARGFIRFFGDGAKGQVLRKTLSVAGQGTARIPFQVEATKGAGPGVPFFIDLKITD